MAKSNLLLVDLNDKQTKKLAETITSGTSRKILNYLADKDTATESQLSEDLNIPISTVHYHLQKLQEASLIVAEEFTYSAKGREINHYKLANKYIIITPRKVSGLKAKLKSILPVAGIMLGISAIIKFVQIIGQGTVQIGKVMAESGVMQEVEMDLAEEAVDDTVAPLLSNSAPEAVRTCVDVGTGAYNQWNFLGDIALWFFLGSMATIAIYFLVLAIREKLNK
ncbi:MAG: helix-turn-helix domain-containing protein [archaeon]|nr:helix-turn-helix domain-containing protein [Nanoarchaeota archaeon]